MKKFRKAFAVLPLLCMVVPLLQSCLDDWDDDDRSSLTIGTVRIIDGKDYYFALDEEPGCIPATPPKSITTRW